VNCDGIPGFGDDQHTAEHDRQVDDRVTKRDGDSAPPHRRFWPAVVAHLTKLFLAEPLPFLLRGLQVPGAPHSHCAENDSNDDESRFPDQPESHSTLSEIRR
jgi:hypothetical protein